VLELGALYSVASRDIPSFQKYIAQVKAYYFDYKDLPKSYFRSQILGLNLLW
jgi:26S proteasome regulatory subunit N12